MSNLIKASLRERIIDWVRKNEPGPTDLGSQQFTAWCLVDDRNPDTCLPDSLQAVVAELTRMCKDGVAGREMFGNAYFYWITPEHLDA